MSNPGENQLANVTSRNLTRALKAAGARGLFLGFTASSCAYCAVHEAEWAAYAAARLTGRAAASLPDLLRVDADHERKLARRHMGSARGASSAERSSATAF